MQASGKLINDLANKQTFDESDLEELKTRFRVDSDVESVYSTSSNIKKEVKKELTDEEVFDKLILTTFHDGNITYYNGSDLKEKQEIDMRNSMLLTLYLNLSSCYMKLNHFNEALKLITKALKIAPTNSIVTFKHSQCIAANLESPIAELTKALENLKKAEEFKKTEKIFQHQPGILKMVGLDNHEQAFKSLKEMLEGRVKELKSMKINRLEEVVKRVDSLNKIEAKIVKDGKVPEEGPSMYRMFGSEDENMESFIMNE